MPLIFQYGTNCTASQINGPERLAGRAVDLGRARTVAEFKIAFNKWSQGRGCAAANLIATKEGGCRVWGVLFEMSDGDLVKLAEKIEGPSYRPIDIDVEDASGQVKTATTFVVRKNRRREGLWTSTEYVRFIVNGLRAHGVEEVDPAYIQHVIDVAVDTNRRAGEAAADQTRQIEALRTR